ncbi:hypothetical protein ACFVHB_06460 [Kitasatospora sp. NPDC127111]|uniref:hypothetical protein n=1 Tax=Kitasatospora sp. NPDC127111 TaxID=3345363 RepID=UPI003624F874
MTARRRSWAVAMANRSHDPAEHRDQRTDRAHRAGDGGEAAPPGRGPSTADAPAAGRDREDGDEPEPPAADRAAP